jgi:hypothetical protein
MDGLVLVGAAWHGVRRLVGTGPRYRAFGRLQVEIYNEDVKDLLSPVKGKQDAGGSLQVRARACVVRACVRARACVRLRVRARRTVKGAAEASVQMSRTRRVGSCVSTCVRVRVRVRVCACVCV